MNLLSAIRNKFMSPKIDKNKLQRIIDIKSEKIIGGVEYYAEGKDGKFIKLAYKDRGGKEVIDYYTCYFRDADSPEKYENMDLNCDVSITAGPIKYDYVKKQVDVLNFDKLLILDEYKRSSVNVQNYQKYKPTDFVENYTFYKLNESTSGGKRKSRRKSKKSKRKTRRS